MSQRIRKRALVDLRLDEPKLTTAHIAVTYDAAGEWMYHCHILEHAERGMMGHLHVME